MLQLIHWVQMFPLFLAFGVAHQAVEEVNPSRDTILVQGE